MIALKKKLVHFENRMDTGFEHFVNCHCIWGYLVIFGAMPLLTLAVVGFCTLVLAVPVGWLLGYI